MFWLSLSTVASLAWRSLLKLDFGAIDLIWLILGGWAGGAWSLLGGLVSEELSDSIS